jgi:hypothetical protein
MPFPRPGSPDEPITAGEWGCISLFVVAAAYGLALAVLT